MSAAVLLNSSEPSSRYGGVVGADSSVGASAELSSPRVFVGDRRRFVVLAAFALLATSNGAQWITFSPIVDEVKEYFGVTAYQVNMLTSTYLFMYVGFVFLNCVTFHKLGFRRGLIVAATLNALGALWKVLTLLAAPTYAMLLISELLGAVTQVLIISAPPLLAGTWFLAEERTVVTALTANFMNLGIAIGVVMPPLIVNPERKDKAAFLEFFVAQSAWAGAALLLILVGVPRKPRTPPSFAADASAADASAAAEGGWENLKRSVTALLRNTAFLLLSGVSAATMGLIWSLAAVLPQILSPFGISEKSAGWMGFSNMVSGSLVATLLGYAIDRRKAFKPALVALVWVFAAVLGMWTLLLIYAPRSAANAVSFACYVLIGFSSNTILPVMMELGVELSFPVAESVGSTALLWAASAASIVLVQVMSALLGNDPSRQDALNVLALSVGSVCLGGLAMIAIVPQHRRHDFEVASAEASLEGSPISPSPEKSRDTFLHRE